MNSRFPEITDSFLSGQDLLYTQFNDIEFYVEDVEQENLYHEILKKLFPDIRIEKIFPLGGKPNVIDAAILNKENKKKVYLVDLDFDEILNRLKTEPNVFYLKKYSIENYLLEFNAIKAIIKEEKPKVKEIQIQSMYDHNSFLEESKNLFSDLISYYLTIHKYELEIENVKCDMARFCDFRTSPACLKTTQLMAYHSQIKTKLRQKKPKVKLETQLKKFKKYFRILVDALKNIPGKYLINFIKVRIEYLFSIASMSPESFTYRMAKHCELNDLNYLKIEIGKFINS